MSMGELLQKFNHYGFDKAIYGECMGLIVRTNRHHAKIINVWFALINAFYFISTNLRMFNVDATRSAFFLIFIIIPMITMGMVTFLGPKGPFFGVMCTVADLIMFEVYSILSSNAEPYASSWMFLILLVIVAFSYIETVGRMTLILLVMSSIFVRSAYLHKPSSIASMDLANTVVVTSLALVLHFAFQRARINEFVTTIRDIKTQRQLMITSSFDALTSLLNRGKFFSLAEQVIEARGEEPIALVLLDLDGFKQINDNLGHQTGDRAIQMAAETIIGSLHIDQQDKWDFPERVLREKSTFAGRLGGDEYIILLQGYPGRDEMFGAVSGILSALHLVDEGDIHGLRASIGITMVKDGEKNIDAAYKRADDALYVSKENGKDQININQF
ncbi:MAG: GGDEF domain-containing protein [Lachnospiraceae bacterium]|nr:GGDEF domain-containing protein [Lachnospiraceae bacterium]